MTIRKKLERLVVDLQINRHASEVLRGTTKKEAEEAQADGNESLAVVLYLNSAKHENFGEGLQYAIDQIQALLKETPEVEQKVIKDDYGVTLAKLRHQAAEGVNVKCSPETAHRLNTGGPYIWNNALWRIKGQPAEQGKRQGPWYVWKVCQSR